MMMKLPIESFLLMTILEPPYILQEVFFLKQLDKISIERRPYKDILQTNFG